MNEVTSLPLLVAITGASGVRYGTKLLKHLRELDIETELIVSNGARKVIEIEEKISDIAEISKLADKVWDESNLGGRPASGSARYRGMVIIPCSMKTLSAIAHDLQSNLIARAASVTLKERRKLVLVPRETPLSRIQIKNMLEVTDAGAVVMPASPGFYGNPTSIEDLLDFISARVLDHLGIQHSIGKRWDPEGLT